MSVKSRRAARVIELLEEEYPEAGCELDFRSPWQLLVATMLSAQSTDVRVNAVTPVLFGRWPEPADLAAAQPDDLQEVIRSVGMFRQKASALQRTARAVGAAATSVDSAPAGQPSPRPSPTKTHAPPPGWQRK